MRIFISGGSTGIGLALVKAYAAKGHIVGTCSRFEEKFRKNYPNCPDTVSFYQVDVRDQEGVAKAIKEFSKPGLDLVIANAGVSIPNKKSLPDFEKARELLDINIYGVLNVLAPSIERMLEQKSGTVALLASVAGMVGLPGAGPYCGSKAYLLKYGESLAIDLEDKGITVSCIAPGFIDTPLTQANNHKMPFLMPVDKAAKIIMDSIEKKKKLVIFPWQMHLLIKLLERMPRFMYRKIMNRVQKSALR